MKRLYSILCALLFMSISLYSFAQTQSIDSINIQNLSILQQNNELIISMEIIFPMIKMKGEEKLIFIPKLSNQNNCVKLPAIIVSGHKRYYYDLRNPQQNQNNEIFAKLKHKKREKISINYEAKIPHKLWMNRSLLEIQEDVSGCCNQLLTSHGKMIDQLAIIPDVDLRYVYSFDEEKKANIRQEIGTAYLDFQLNCATINPNFHHNIQQLANIQNQIQKIDSNKTYSLIAISIQGYASPDGPYRINEKLAHQRSIAAKKYIQSLKIVPDSLIAVEYIAEDWKRLESMIKEINLSSKDSVLAIIHSQQSPDAHEQALRKLNNGADFNILKKEIFPYLRRADYIIKYNVNDCSSKEAMHKLKTNPQSLSLDELDYLARQYSQDSDEFQKIIELAVQLYPNENSTNINATNLALSRHDLRKAEFHLRRLKGNDALILHTRGLYALLSNDISFAEILLNQAKKQGITEADHNLRELKRISNI